MLKRHRIPLVCAAVAAALLSLQACVSTPQAEAQRAQQMNDMGNVINDLRQQIAEVNTQLDSIRTVMAKQDTTNARLANATGVVVVK